MESFKTLFLIALCLLPLCLLPLGAKGGITKNKPTLIQPNLRPLPVQRPSLQTEDVLPQVQGVLHVPPIQDESPPPPEVPPPQPVPEPPAEEPDADALSPHFRLQEFRCNCGTCSGFTAYPDPQLVAVLEAIRMRCGSPVIITSGIRCPSENDAVGGVPNSYHLIGKAADIYCPGLTTEELLSRTDGLGILAIPYYHQGFIHIQVP